MVSYRPEIEWKFCDLIEGKNSGITADQFIACYKKNDKDDSRRMFYVLAKAVSCGNLEIAKKLLKAGAPTAIVYNSSTDYIMLNKSAYQIEKISDAFTSKSTDELIKFITEESIKQLPEIISSIKEQDNKNRQGFIKAFPEIYDNKSSVPSKMEEKTKKTIEKLNNLSAELIITNNLPMEKVIQELKLKEEMYTSKYEFSPASKTKNFNEAKNKMDQASEKLKKYQENIMAIETKNATLLVKNTELTKKLVEKSFEPKNSDKSICFCKIVNEKREVLTKEELAALLIKKASDSNQTIQDILTNILNNAKIFEDNKKDIPLFITDILTSVEEYKQKTNNETEIKGNKQEIQRNEQTFQEEFKKRKASQNTLNRTL